MNESTFFCFGDFRLIPAHRELWRSNQPVRVQPRVLDTLVYLIQHRDRAVGRDELISAVWGRIDIADNVLSQIVARARQAVGDDAESQLAIRTVPRFGYRWVGQVDMASVDSDHPIELAATLAQGTTTTLPPVPTATATPRRRWSALAAVLLLVPLSLVGWRVVEHRANAIASVMTAPTTVPAEPASHAVSGSDAEPQQPLRAALASNQLDKARTLFRTLSDRQRIQPEVRYLAAELALKEGRFTEAANAFTALLTDLGDNGPAELIGSSLYGAGLAEFRQNELESAQRHLDHAIPILEKVGADARVTLGLAWSTLGRLHSSRDAFDDADRAYAQARIALEAAGEPGALASLESNVGVTLIGRYRYVEALARFQRAADLAAQSNDVNAEARARMNLVNAYLVLLQPAKALDQEPRLRELRERIGDPVIAGAVDVIRTKLFTANGRLADAKLVMRAHHSRPVPQDTVLIAGRDLATAELAFEQGDLDAGITQLRALLALPWDVFGDDGVAAYVRWRLLDARQALGSHEGTAEAIAAADALNRARPNEPTVLLYATLAGAERADGQGDPTRTRSEFEHALALAESTRVPFDLVRVATRYTQFLLRQGDVSRARAVADRIAEWSSQDYRASLVRLDVDHALGGDAWVAALDQTRRLAGERTIPPALTISPAPTPPVLEPALKGAEIAAVREP